MANPQDLPLQPEFYLIRKDSHNMVPLIAIDELPDHIVIRDVPRVYTEDTVGEMRCVGMRDPRHLKYCVVSNNQSPHTVLKGNTLESPFMSPSKVPSIAAAKISTDEQPLVSTPDQKYSPLGTDSQGSPSETVTQQSVVSTPADRLIRQDVAAQLTTTAQANQPLPIAANVPTPGIKEYCSYWLRKGECDYAQQGCLYKHEMPTDLETLNRLGLRDIPAWYRDKYKVGSFLAVKGAGASFAGSNLQSLTSTHRFSAQARRGYALPRGSFSDNLSGSERSRRGGGRNTPRIRRLLTAPPPSKGATSPPQNVVAARGSPLFGQSKLKRHETLADRERMETIKAIETYEKLDVLRRFDRPALCTPSVPSDHGGEEVDASVMTLSTDSGKSRANDQVSPETTAATPNLIDFDLPDLSRSARAQSDASMYTGTPSGRDSATTDSTEKSINYAEERKKNDAARDAKVIESVTDTQSIRGGYTNTGTNVYASTNNNGNGRRRNRRRYRGRQRQEPSMAPARVTPPAPAAPLAAPITVVAASTGHASNEAGIKQ